jgi:hypothetical protein
MFLGDRTLEHAVDKLIVLLIATKVLDEMADNPVRLIEVPATRVRRYITVGCGPECMIRRQGLRISYIQVRGGKVA